MPIEPLLPGALRRALSPESISLPSASPDAKADPVGQERALEALRFGVAMPGEGYNLFVAGNPGVGRHSIVRALLEAQAKSEPVPRDVCCVQDFARPERPRSLMLPKGLAAKLRDDVAQLVSDLGTVLPAAFDAEEFRREKQRIEHDFKAEHEARLLKLKSDSEARHVAVLPTPMGFAVAPMQGDTILEPDAYEKLPEATRAVFDADMEKTKEALREILEDVPRVQKKMRASLRALVEATAARSVRHLVEDVKREWSGEPAVLAHLDALERDVCENVGDFMKVEEGGETGLGGLRDRPLRRYEVNVLVDHAATESAPVVYENHPTYANLFGRIEHEQHFGALVTSLGLIKAGALHRANGGYLILDARELLLQPFAWEGLKRALLSRVVRLESPAQAYGLLPTVSLEPEPIPLSVKVVLIGDRQLKDLLERVEPDFDALFKVIVDFDDVVVRSDTNVGRYAQLLASVAQAEGLLPLDRTALARLLEEMTRLAGDTQKLSARVLDAFALVRESAFLAKREGATEVRASHVESAVSAQERRSGRLREHVLEAIEQGTVAIASDGSSVGQVNGLSVAVLGRASFGRPTRISATVRIGRGQVVDIEREVELGGPIHSKGVLILSSYLGARYAPETPLSLRASLVFEQSYGIVEGDSASCAELCALLSALADVPLRQSVAVTGSVNQRGEVQAIGGVNEKIEGFYSVCKARGLTGSQGVVIPRANVRHLMLREEVVQAVAQGKFSVWAAGHADEVLELLSEMPAGRREASGAFSPGSFNAKVEARLVALAERRQSLERAGEPDKPT